MKDAKARKRTPQGGPASATDVVGEGRGDPCVEVHRGARFLIKGVKLANGSVPAVEFIEGLEKSDQVKVKRLLQTMSDSGCINNREKYKKVEGQIWEFKSFQIRIGCFYSGASKLFLTHGFIKKSPEWPPSELERANNIRKEHEESHGD